MNKKLSWFTGAICGAVLAFGLSISGYAASAEQSPTPSIERTIRMANSKADHESLAAHYENEAKELQAKAQEHVEMSKAYAGTHMINKHDLENHCKRIAQRYTDAARESLEMAKIHRDLADKADK